MVRQAAAVSSGRVTRNGGWQVLEVGNAHFDGDETGRCLEAASPRRCRVKHQSSLSVLL